MKDIIDLNPTFLRFVVCWRNPLCKLNTLSAITRDKFQGRHGPNLKIIKEDHEPHSIEYLIIER